MWLRNLTRPALVLALLLGGLGVASAQEPAGQATPPAATQPAAAPESTPAGQPTPAPTPAAAAPEGTVDIRSLLPPESEAPKASPNPTFEDALNLKDYVLQAGDKLNINILALPSEVKDYEIRLDGRFYHPVVGEVLAAGKTLAQLEDDFRKILSKELRNPTFQIGIVALSDTEVAVLGEVKNQGKYAVAPGSNVLDVLARAGGLSESADLTGAILMRGGQQLPVTLVPPATPQDPPLVKVRPGDILYVHAGKRISVSGEVFQPAIFALSRGYANPREALRRAGGGKTSAALTRVRLVRPSLAEPIVLDLTPGKNIEFPEAARELQEGDVLIVPARQAIVIGATGGGPHPLEGGETLIDVITARGVSPEKSALNEVRVIRSADLRSGKEQVPIEEYDVEKFYTDGDTSAAVPINDGDVVFIPPKDQGGFLGMFGGNGGGFGGLGLLGLARMFLKF